MTLAATDSVDTNEAKIDTAGQPWQKYPVTFRNREVQQIARWIRTNTSGSIIGLEGAGKSDFVGFFCHREDALRRHLPANFPTLHPLVLDLNTLPEPSLAALYRVMIRTFSEAEERFAPQDRSLIQTRYREVRHSRDAFLAQSAVRELLRHFERRREKIILVLDRFDAASNLITPRMGDSLRGLRDSFKRTLSYITCMHVDYAYIENADFLGDLNRLVNGQICYLGPLTTEDATATITQRIAHKDQAPNREELERLLALSGCYPALLRAVWEWWLTADPLPAMAEWRRHLMQEAAIIRRLHDIWLGLTQEEQIVLTELVQIDSELGQLPTDHAFLSEQQVVLARLCQKGLCRMIEIKNHTGAQTGTEKVETVKVVSQLLMEYTRSAGQKSRGRITEDLRTGQIYQGERLLPALSPKESTLLRYLLTYSSQRLSYTDLIVAVWDEKERYHGISNDSLFQIVRSLRLKIEPTPSEPVYLINWRGRPEGGYQLFPEGKPQ